MGSPDLLRRVVLPVASTDDARDTCRAAIPYIVNANGEAIAVHVVETNPGGMNKAPLAALQEEGEQALSVVRGQCEDHSIPIQTEIRYGPKVNEEVFDVARSREATSVGFIPRAGSRLGKFLSGDNALSMITQNDMPVVAFPRETSLTDSGAETKEGR